MSAHADRVSAALARYGTEVELGAGPVRVAVFAMPPGSAKTHLFAGEVDLALKPILGVWAPASCSAVLDDMTTIEGRAVTVRYVRPYFIGDEAVAKLYLLW